MLETEFNILRTERLYDALPHPVTIYGIRAGRGEETVYLIEDFSLSESYTRQIIDILQKESPEDIHIAEIIADYIY